MSLKDVEPGVYTAKVVDWGVEEIEKLGGALKAVVVFEMENQEKIKWDGFFLKRDGEINIKTKNTLLACGLKGDFGALLDDGAGLDTEKELEITIVQDGDYLKVEWVNEPGGSQFIKKSNNASLTKTLKGMSLQAGLRKDEPPVLDQSEEVPF